MGTPTTVVPGTVDAGTVDAGTAEPGSAATAGPAGRPGERPEPRPRVDRGGPSRPAAQPPETTGRTRRERQEEASDRFLRALVTYRGTQVSSEAAMRAREAGLPDAQDMAAAEREVVVKRRYYTPSEDLPTGKARTGRSGPRG